MNIHRLPALAALGTALAAGHTWAACPPPVAQETHSYTAYVPRDAPVGSVITGNSVNYDTSVGHRCEGRPVLLEMLAGPAEPSVPAASNGSTATRDIGNHLYKTNIPGIAIAAVMGTGSLCYSPSGGLIPDSDRYFPKSAFSCPGSNYMTRFYYWLYKTGPIAPGSHQLNLNALRVMFNGTLQSSLTLSQTIVVAGCAMPSAGNNQVDVTMAPTNVKDFSTAGSAGASKAFAITLQTCTAGTYSRNYPWNYFLGNFANVRLEPSKGSTVVDADLGIIGLRPESTATGIGVQILKNDRSPIALNQEVPILHVQDGITEVPLLARYIQVGDTPVEGGTANATVNFTVTFR